MDMNQLAPRFHAPAADPALHGPHLRSVAHEPALVHDDEALHLGLRAAHAGAWEWNLGTRELHWSPESHRLYGLADTAPLSLGRWRDCIHPDDRAAVVEAFDRAVAGRGVPYHCEYRVNHLQGGVRWLADFGRLVHDPDGTPLCLAGITLDVSARKEAERARLSADTFRDEFIAMLAHEMRNAIAPIVYASALLERGIEGMSRINAQRVLTRQANHLNELMRDLGDLSNIKQGRLTLLRTRGDLRRVLEQALEQAQPRMAQKGQRLQVQLPEQPLPVNADLRRLVQVFSNLLINAVKYTPPGGRLTLRARAGVAGGSIVEIEDDGIGIDPVAQSHVFDLFVRVAPGGEAGFGIGLALVRRIVDLHGGRVEVRSEGLGRGSVFVVTLP